METPASQSNFPFSLALGSKSTPPSQKETKNLMLRKGNYNPGMYQEYYSSEAISTIIIANKLAKNLTSVAISNDSTEKTQSVFTASKLPKISVNDYFIRISKFSYCSVESLILSVIYLDRYFENSLVCLNNRNIHRLFNQSVFGWNAAGYQVQ